MARIPNNELDRLKREVSLVRLVESSGIELKKHGKDYLGLGDQWRSMGSINGVRVIDFIK